MLYKSYRVRKFLLRNRACYVYLTLAVHDTPNARPWSFGRDCFSAVLPNDNEFQRKKAKCAYVSKVALKAEKDELVISVRLPDEQQNAVQTSVYTHFEAMKTTALWYATKVQLPDLMKRFSESGQASVPSSASREIQVNVNLPRRDVKLPSFPVSLVLSPASLVAPKSTLPTRSSRGLLLESETLPMATVTLIDVPIGQRDSCDCPKMLQLSRFASGRVWLEQRIQKPAQKSECACCKCAEVSTVCLPCGHLCLCSDCAKKMVVRRRQHYKSVSGLYERVAQQLDKSDAGTVALSALTSLPSAAAVWKIKCPVCLADAEPVEIVRSIEQYKALLQDQTVTINSHIENETFQAVVDNMIIQ